jgi:3-oxoacyl-[acyl-carrier-protein] synthase II
MTGHTLGAAGGVEAVICTLVCANGVVPPTINFTEADPACDLDYAHDGLREMAVRSALSNSFGFGGHNACVVVRRWDGD